MQEVFDTVAEPVATPGTRGAWRGARRPVAVDGFDVDLPDSKENVAEFGYARSGPNRSAYARCGGRAGRVRHAAFLAGEVAGYGTGEKTLARRLYPHLHGDEIFTADRTSTELIVLPTTLTDPREVRADELAPGYHQRREQEPAMTS